MHELLIFVKEGQIKKIGQSKMTRRRKYPRLPSESNKRIEFAARGGQCGGRSSAAVGKAEISSHGNIPSAMRPVCTVCCATFTQFRYSVFQAKDIVTQTERFVKRFLKFCLFMDFFCLNCGAEREKCRSERRRWRGIVRFYFVLDEKIYSLVPIFHLIIFSCRSIIEIKFLKERIKGRTVR